jgi:hypothetical protein
MRRALHLLAAGLVVAASAASAQARATSVASLVPQAKGPPLAAVHVSKLLGAPEWLDDWGNANFIQLHWKVQAWRDRIFGGSQPAVEWDVCVQQVPGLDVFHYVERVTGQPKTKTFGTLDSLKVWLAQDVTVPLQRTLSPGKWYYLIDVHVSTASENPCDPRTAANKGGFLSGVMLNGPSRDLEQRKLSFAVPEP